MVAEQLHPAVVGTQKFSDGDIKGALTEGFASVDKEYAFFSSIFFLIFLVLLNFVTKIPGWLGQQLSLVWSQMEL